MNLPTYALSALAHYGRPLWVGFGNIESEYIRKKIDNIKLGQAVYVSGLARSGTTVILNFLHETGAFGSLTYRHYPFIYFPYIWHKIMGISKNTEQQERTHFDRIKVNIDSPEALEEPIWRYFFPSSFEQETGYPPGEETSNPKFEKYYADIIKKVLLTSGKENYLAKGNYNLARIAYILKNNERAKFVLCVREPLSHIASLIKQHYLFTKIEEKDSRLLNYMEWIGHKEFGLNRHPVYLGAPEEYERIINHWEKGEEIEGWARQWKYTYDFLYKGVLQDPALAERIYLLRYEELCAHPHEELEKLIQFCDIGQPSNLKETAQNISPPDYYSLPFSNQEKQVISGITDKTRALIYEH